MVRLVLQLKADLQNVDRLVPSKDFVFFFKIQCSSCRETHPNWVGLDPTNDTEISGSRGSANLVWKCKVCKKEHSANFEKDLGVKPYVLNNVDRDGFAPIAYFDCRGCEFVDFDPKGVWSCVGSESETPFDSVELDFDSKEWTDFDEKANEVVYVMITESKITSAAATKSGKKK